MFLTNDYLGSMITCIQVTYDAILILNKIEPALGIYV